MPKPLLTKLISQTVIGFFFLLVGCVYGIHSKDNIFYYAEPVHRAFQPDLYL